MHFEEEEGLEVQEYCQSVKVGFEDEWVVEEGDDVLGCPECDCHIHSGGQLYEHVRGYLEVFDP